MIVVTLTAVAPKGPVILAECKNTPLKDGDKVHCDPDLANAMVARYGDHLTKGAYWDRPGVLAGGKWEVERAGAAVAPPPAPTTSEARPTSIPAADRSMASGKNKNRGGVRGKETTAGG